MNDSSTRLYSALCDELKSNDAVWSRASHPMKEGFEACREKYTGWIPNNSGLLRWQRIALPSSDGIVTPSGPKGRYAFVFSTCTSEGMDHGTIECIDFKLDLRDDFPTFVQTIRDFWRAMLYKDPRTQTRRIRDKLRFFSKNGLSLRAQPVFYTSVAFSDDNGNPVKVGEGHKVDDGTYKGRAVLAFFSKTHYDAAFGDGIYSRIMHNDFASRLANCYRAVNSGSGSRCTALRNRREELAQRIKANPPLWTFEADYTVRSKGRIEIDKIEVQASEDATASTVRALTQQEGYKHTVQLIYGLIKSVFHADNHHHEKDDVILQVYTGERPVAILDQLASHIKDLEKIEQGREHMPCRHYIPQYTNEAEGVAGYAEMYYENYIRNYKSSTTDSEELNRDEKIIRNEGARLLAATNVLVKSLKASVSRFEEGEKRRTRADLNSSHLRTPSIWIMLIGLSALMFNIVGKTGLSINQDSPGFAKTYVSTLVCAANSINASILVILGLLAFYFFFKGWVDFWLCRFTTLSSDLRPRDERAAFYFDRSLTARLFKLIPLGLLIAFFISLWTDRSIAFYEELTESKIESATEFYSDFQNCKNDCFVNEKSVESHCVIKKCEDANETVLGKAGADS